MPDLLWQLVLISVQPAFVDGFEFHFHIQTRNLLKRKTYVFNVYTEIKCYRQPADYSKYLTFLLFITNYGLSIVSPS